MLKSGSLIDGKYRVNKMIGKGGIGEVYLAENERIHMPVALKVMKSKTEGVADVYNKLFTAEVNALKELRHPGLPNVYDAIIEDGMYIEVLDYIQGQSLSELVNEQGAQPQNLVIDWGLQLCNILNYLHSRTPPIIYLDMKPSNIILKSDGQLVLIDFGGSFICGSSDRIMSATRFYSPPEQFAKDGIIDVKTDIFALGMTLFHFATGRLPVSPDDPKLIRQYDSSLSADLEKIIFKCTQKDPDMRFRSVQELQQALSKINNKRPRFHGGDIFERKLNKQKPQCVFKRKSGRDTLNTVKHIAQSSDMILYNAKLLLDHENNLE